LRRLAAAAGSILVACTPLTTGGTEPEGPGDAVAVVTRVYDGDTVEVESGGRRFDVRLDGLNAPDDGECLYAEAGDRLEAMVGDRDLTIEEHGIDQFDRVLASLWDFDISVNESMVATGMAIATTPGEDGGPDLIDVEETAYQDGLGLWGGCGAGPAPEVVIERVDHDPPGPDDERLDEEAVILVNEGPAVVDLEGWVLRDESSRHRHHFGSVVLDPGETVTVTSADPGWDPGGGSVWNNGGDMALLLDGGGRVVARLRY
jgi:endonuclease YncB( thermonuclease family)